MATQVTIQQPARLAEERQALKAVLDSPRFKKNPRLTKLLDYICQKYFEGDTDSIKEYSIAADVFHRPESFDQTTDSIVRVEVYRLRKKLRDFYEAEGADQPIEIVVATGHYLPEFVRRGPRETLPVESDEEDRSRSSTDALVSDQRPAKVISRPFGKVAFLFLAVSVLLIAAVFWLPRTRHGYDCVPKIHGENDRADSTIGAGSRQGGPESVSLQFRVERSGYRLGRLPHHRASVPAWQRSCMEGCAHAQGRCMDRYRSQGADHARHLGELCTSRPSRRGRHGTLAARYGRCAARCRSAAIVDCAAAALQNRIITRIFGVLGFPFEDGTWLSRIGLVVIGR